MFSISKKPILWITPKWPIPPNDGARRASYNLIRGLTELGIPITLFSFLSADDIPDIPRAIEELKTENVYTFRPWFSSRSRLDTLLGMTESAFSAPLLPLTMRYFTRGTPTNLSPYSAIVYDGLHVAAHWESLGRFVPPEDLKIPLIYRAHNRECQIWERKSSTCAFYLKPFFQVQAKLVKRFEDSVTERASFVATVSDNDKDLFKKTHENFITVPIGCEFDYLSRPGDSNQVLYVGRLDWPPNREGLEWFLQKVWPEVVKKNPDRHLTIAGSGDGNWLHKYAHLQQVTFAGRVPDVREYYERSAIAIVPIFYGSGTRVKAIEASAFGRVVLSTRVGIEGLPLEAKQACFLGEDAETWIRIITSYATQDTVEYGRRAFDALRDTYGIQGAASIFAQELEKAIG
jgi:glycosyltransferase involved in cell wall biosynthesis